MHERAKILEDQLLSFGPYRLDPESGQLWRGKQVVKLTLKAMALLRLLVQHAGQVVTKEECFRLVWPDTVVGETTLTSCILELRRVLRDNARNPRYIETVHRRGYRFIAPLTTALPVQSPKSQVQSPYSAIRIPHSAIPLVGRETELTQLSTCWEKALNGERQMVFITGEPGIGKTALIEAFLQNLASPVPGPALEQGRRPGSRGQGSVFTPTPNPQPPAPFPWIGRGQCIEQFGAGEPYLPVLQALEELGRQPGGQQLITVLHRHAPIWLMQLPAFLDEVDLDLLQRKTAGVTRERMLREMAGALEILTLEHPLILVLEDLQWSDVSTLELLSYLARRPEWARLLVIATYRPVEILTDGHPLKRVTQELFAHALGKELTLRRLHETEVSTYLTLRFPHSVLPTRLGQVLYQRTGGNPLFMTSLVQDLLNREVILPGDNGRWEFQGEVAELETWTPESVRHLLARQRERLLPDEQQVLEAASLSGLEFSAATVAAALETEVTQVEDHCGRLAEQQQFLHYAGISEWPDGTRAARYGFVHALYQEFWHERVSVGKQQQWHLRMGERMEAAYGVRAREIAAELALHFAEGRDYRRAVQYLHQASENAVRRSAHQEAINLLTRGLGLLKTLPDTPERTQQELALQIALGVPLILTKGHAAPEVERTYNRARELCRQVGEAPQLFSVLLGLRRFYFLRGQLRTARELTEQLLASAQSLQEPGLLARAHLMLGEALYYLGEFTQSREHLEQGTVLHDPQQHRFSASVYGSDTGVTCLSFITFPLWILGYPDQALKRSHEALALAQEFVHPFSLAYAFICAATLHRFRGEGWIAQEWIEKAIALCSEQGFALHLAVGTILRGGALTQQEQVKEGIAQIRQGLAALQATGAELMRPSSTAWLAEAYGKAGQAEEGLSVLAEALGTVNKTGERYYEAELYRLKGELTLQKFQVPSSEFQVQENQKAKPCPEPFGCAQDKLRRRGKGRKKLLVISSQLSVPSTQHLTPSTHVEAETEACFLKAIEIAHKQQAKSLELRATVSLARLWHQQGKKKRARQMLAEIYNWFTEGFDTKDLKEAKTLIEELDH
jgi:predicted ATPase/DNA-binding winged helix-turn-helix (wHTH) protein